MSALMWAGVVALALAGVVSGFVALARAAHRADTYDPALEQYAFGVKFESAGVGDPHDQRQGEKASARAVVAARRQRKVAAQRAVPKPVRVPVTNVESIDKKRRHG